jgi:hypothetical protein
MTLPAGGTGRCRAEWRLFLAEGRGTDRFPEKQYIPPYMICKVNIGDDSVMIR